MIYSYHDIKKQQDNYTRGNPNTFFKYGKVLDFFKQLMSFGIFIGLIFLVYLYWEQSVEDITDTSILNKIGFYISKIIIISFFLFSLSYVFF